MNDDTNSLHPWIEPEFEARLTALVLGEASDFEREELERLVAERPELALYRKRLEAMHRMLREVAKGESAEDRGEWKLAAERREALLAKLGAEPDHKKAVVPIQRPKSRSRMGLLIRIAACVAVAGLFLSLIWPASTGVLRKVKSPADGGMDFAYQVTEGEFSDRYGRNFRSELETTAGESITEVSVGRTAGIESLAAISVGDDVSTELSSPGLADEALDLRQRTQATAAPNSASFFSVSTNPVPQGKAVEDLRRGLTSSWAEPAAPRLPSLAAVDSDGDSETRGFRAKTNEAALGDLEERELRELDRANRSIQPAPAKKELQEEKRRESEMAESSGAGGGVALGLDFTPLAADKPMPPTSAPAPALAMTGEALIDQERLEKVAERPSLESKPVEFDGFIDLQERDGEERGAQAARGRWYFAENGQAGGGNGSKNGETNAGRLFGAGGTVGGVGGAVNSANGFAFEAPAGIDGLERSEAAKQEGATILDRLSERTRSLEEAPAQEKNEVANANGSIAFSNINVPTADHFEISQSGPLSELDLAKSGQAIRTDDFKTAGTKVDESVDAILALTPQVRQGQRPDLNASSGSGGAMRVAGGGEATETEAVSSLEVSDNDFLQRQTPAEKGLGFELRYANGPAEGKASSLSTNAATPSSDLLTQVYQVPPTFLSPPTDEANIGDPFASPVSAGGSPAPGGRVTAKEVLESAGISFPEGSTVIYNAETSQLIVRNTRDQIELVEALTESLRSDTSEKEVFAQSKFVVPAALDETSTEAEPFSTFSLHVSDVSFQLAKAALASGQWPETEKIRIEEFVNAFDYGDPVPSMDERVACRIDQGAHPFLQQRNLVRIALRTAEAGRSAGTPLRLTLLLDSSGSMERPDRRETLTRAVATLAGLLGENDRVNLVSFARQPRLVADAVPGNEAMKLAETVASLPSEGGTNLEAALQLAFEKAREHREPIAQNRIVLLTDGAANLGDAKAESLGQRVELMRDSGIAFDAAGFGAEGLNDEILEALTRKGDGRYYLLDRPEDAGEAFAEQIAGALRPAAKNVKVQVEFNPDRVKSYKLLGFEKHLLATEDFRNDAVDAAEMAAAEAGVAVYQVEPIPGGEGDLGSVSVRFRDLDSGEMIERRWALPHLASAPSAEQGGEAILLATVASQFAAKLAGGPLGDVVDLGELARLAADLPDGARVQELRTMIEQARNLEGASVGF